MPVTENHVLDTPASTRSREIQEIMGTPPGWLVSYGSTLFFAIIVIILAGSWIIHYPDTIGARVTLTSLQPPATLTARASGYIAQLRVKDRQSVQKGELLAVIDNPAHSEQVQKLENELRAFKPFFEKPDTQFKFSGFDQLGELQADYSGFIKSYMTYCLASDQQFKKENLLPKLHQHYTQLQASLDIWQHKYVLKAPIAGKVSLHKIWNNQQSVSAGEEIMAVVSTSSPLLCKATMAAKGAGKVKIGQSVIIRLDNYPYNEFGFVEGKVDNLSLLPRENASMVTIALPEGLRTNYRQTLPFRQEMQGEAEIITEDLRLIERFFYRIRKIFDDK